MFSDINVIDISRIDLERKQDGHHAKTKLAALQYQSTHWNAVNTVINGSKKRGGRIARAGSNFLT